MQSELFMTRPVFHTRTAPFFFQNLYTSKPPSKYPFRTGNLQSIPLKRAKFGQFSIHFCGHYLRNKILAQKTSICNLEYYSKTSGSLRQKKRDEPALYNNGVVADFPDYNNNASLKFKQKITGQTGDNGTKDF